MNGNIIITCNYAESVHEGVFFLHKISTLFEYLLVKKRMGLAVMMRRKIIGLLLLSTVALASCSKAEQAFESPFSGEVQHVHGIGYAGNGDTLYFASHAGLKLYRGDEWMETTRQVNDYMGFSPTDEGFYASGHPGAQSELPNPLGIQKSTDGGETLKGQAFEGEVDFHYLASGYRSHDILVLNEEPNAKMGQGLYLSEDGAKSWIGIKGNGLTGGLIALALHPSNSAIMAVGTDEGVFLSKDRGDHFELVKKGEQGTALYFNEDLLYYATFDGKPGLAYLDLDKGVHQSLKLPQMKEDGIVFIAQKATDKKTLAIYTQKGQSYITDNSSKSWKQIIQNSKVQ